MSLHISTVQKTSWPDLAALWEASVRATHDFLAEEEICDLRQEVETHYLSAVELRACQNEQARFVGFVGVAGNRVEMLFVAPEWQRKGVGRLLLDYAVSKMGVTALDVNEHNPQAIAFYQKMGFVVKGRSALDGQGRPHPLLHLHLANSAERSSAQQIKGNMDKSKPLHTL